MSAAFAFRKWNKLAFTSLFNAIVLKRIWLWILIKTNKYSWQKWDQRKSQDNQKIQIIKVQIIKVWLYPDLTSPTSTQLAKIPLKLRSARLNNPLVFTPSAFLSIGKELKTRRDWTEECLDETHQFYISYPLHTWRHTTAILTLSINWMFHRRYMNCHIFYHTMTPP